MNKLLIAVMTAAFAASPAFVSAQTTAPAKDEKKAEAKKDAAPATTEAKKEAAPAKKEAAPATTEAKKEEKKKPKGGC
jgi:hypothetical protein